MSVLTHLRQLSPNKRVLTPIEARWIAERQANAFRKLTGYLDEPLLPSEVITGQPRIRLLVASRMDHSGLSGWDHESKTWRVVINGTHAPTRQRFTLAHEYKHVIDASSHQTTYRAIGGYSAHDQAEDACDYFAGCLLVPKRLLKRVWAEGVQDTRTLARTFGVSPAAMRVRLSQVGLQGSRGRHDLFFRELPITDALAPVWSKARVWEVS